MSLEKNDGGCAVDAGDDGSDEDADGVVEVGVAVADEMAMGGDVGDIDNGVL